MIQRAQSIYLILAAICLSITFLLPFSTYTPDIVDSATFSFSGLGFDKSGVIFPLIFNIIVSILLSIITIALYKNRKKQFFINKVNFLSLLIILGGMFWNFTLIETDLLITNKEIISYGVGMFMPIAALVFLIMAHRGIKKDEELIKSMDRIR